MTLLSGSPCSLSCNYAENGLRWASIRAGRTIGREAGRVRCGMGPRKDILPAVEAISDARLTRAGKGAESGSLGHSVPEADEKRNEEGVLPRARTQDLRFLPGLELGNPVGGAPLLYRPYMDHLWATLAKKAPDFKSLDLEPDFKRQTSKTARVVNWLCSASRLRRIRMTYFDGGSAVQAFNSLIYPEFGYDVPLLGIDLLSFGANKILCVIDFTPLTQDPAYLDKYTSPLAPSRAKIAELCGRMTKKFYDESLFFSDQLIFYRSELGAKDPVLEVPKGLLFSTYVDYIDTYLRILHAAKPNEDPLRMSYVASRQNAYNEYSEERDPAIKIFNKHFGEQWSERFTSEFLFKMAPLEEGEIQL